MIAENRNDSSRYSIGPRPWLVFSSWCLVLLVVLGCGDAGYRAYDSVKKAAPSAGEFASGSEYESGIVGMNQGRGGDGDKSKQETALPKDRKIIFSAKMTTVVEDLSGVNEKVKEAVDAAGGYVASKKMNLQSTYRPSGTWVVRVPVEKFQSFLASVNSIGTIESSSTNSQDVTEEYVDSQARLKNQKKLEERILKLLDRPGDEIQHVIKVEEELARVRQVIERIEGRLRYLSDRVSFSTVTITVRQQKSYIPEEKQTFGTRIASAWSSSWNAAQANGENFVISVVASAPTLLFFVFIVLPICWLIYRKIKSKLFPAAG